MAFPDELLPKYIWQNLQGRLTKHHPLEYWKRSSENNYFHFDGIDTEFLLLITLVQFVQADHLIVETKQTYWQHKYLTNVILKDFTQRKKWALNYGGGFKNG